MSSDKSTPIFSFASDPASSAAAPPPVTESPSSAASSQAQKVVAGGKAVPKKPARQAISERIPQLRTFTNKVGLSKLPLQKESWCKRVGGLFTMMLAGCRGTGKTTFLNTLIGEDLEESETACEPMQVRSRKFALVEERFNLDLTVVDMPDFGNHIDNQNTWLPLVKYLEYQFRSYLVQEEQPNRESINDNRVHVCVYFLAPTNTDLNSLDIEAMKEISKRVSLIPIIARSDTLNKEELLNFKATVNDTLKENNIEVCKYLTDGFAMEKVNTYSPYAVIGSNITYKNADGKLVRARKYGWGMVEVENPEHCDFVHLRDLLMSEHNLDLVTSMETHYNDYRKRFLQQRLNSTRTHFKSGEQISALNGEEDGLASYVLYKKNLSVDDIAELEKFNGEEEKIQAEARSLLDEMIRKQEATFREFKAALMTKQKIYNNDLEESHQIVQQLEKEVLQLAGNDREVLKEIAQKAGLVYGTKVTAPPVADVESTTLGTGFTIMF